MCYPVNCRVCSKTTWGGCGHHVASIKASVPAAQWCKGQHTAEELAAAKPRSPFARFFGH